jgi:hypothetical protein
VSVPHVLNWVRSTSFSLHLGQIRASILASRQPLQIAAKTLSSKFATSVEEEEEEEGEEEEILAACGAVEAAYRKGDTINVIGGVGGAPTTLTLLAGSVEAGSPVVDLAEEEEGGRGGNRGKRKRRKEASDSD